MRPTDPDDKVDFSAYFTAEEKSRYDKEYDDLPEELKREGPDLKFKPEERVEDADVIRGGDWTFEAVWTPGHCSNHLCYELKEERTLFTGDHVMGWATSVVGPPDGSMLDYMASLRKLLPRDVDRFRPTHGPVIEEPIAYVQSFIDHREDREAQILQLPRRGSEADPRLRAGHVRGLRQAPLVPGRGVGVRAHAAPRRDRPGAGGRRRRAEAPLHLRPGGRLTARPELNRRGPA